MMDRWWDFLGPDCPGYNYLCYSMRAILVEGRETRVYVGKGRGSHTDDGHGFGSLVSGGGGWWC